MSQSNTFHRFLDDAILKRRLTGKQFADLTSYSAGQVSKMRSGKRKTDKFMRVTVSRILKDVRLSMVSASADYHIPTFMFDATSRKDVFTTSNDQRREERERQGLEESYNEAVRIPKEKRTDEQRQAISKYLRNYMEEYTSEETDWLAKAEYAGLDDDQIFQMYDGFLKDYGVKE
ncbi:hypothetical protein [Lactobacillus plantarum] [Lactiplantibacillus mudanjiangensis]|uniref:hypothetical protein n=1 Tax=Lactiplantibacillus mudanjiangensis TaxID=1296538 RepID=UPI00101554CB|nr:hypothetical protein [Lactobacillus plantarum] [Lactiplantibacillus mudanjiangensis]